MKLIAHRGNTHGPDSINENNPDQIDKALALGYDAEVDIRYDPLTDVFWLGHDRPDYKVSWYWLANRYELLWMHCKDITTLHELVAKASHKYQYFFHNEDDFTLTSMDSANQVAHSPSRQFPIYSYINGKMNVIYELYIKREIIYNI